MCAVGHPDEIGSSKNTKTPRTRSDRWKGGNTPDAVDRKGVRNILEALVAKPRKKPVKKVGGL